MNATQLNGLERKLLGEVTASSGSEWAARDGAESGSDGEEEGSSLSAAPAAAAPQTAAAMPPPLRDHRYGHNTGPKGVQMDHDDHVRMEALQRKRKAMETYAAMERSTIGVYTDEPSVSLSSERAREREASAQREARRLAGDDDDAAAEAELDGGARVMVASGAVGTDDSDDDDEDAFFAEYRSRRMEQMKLHSARAATLPAHGAVGVVSPTQFLDELKACDPRAFVVVMLHEEAIAVSRRLASCLDEVARRHPYARFLRMTASEADPGLDPDVLPVLSIYKGGELVDAVLCVGATLGASFAPEDVEELLVGNGAVL